MAEQKTIEIPNSHQSEMMILGCMLTSSNSLNFAAEGVGE
jgi:hypothetical protein